MFATLSAFGFEIPQEAGYAFIGVGSVTNLLTLPSVSNVAAGNTATIECPVGGHTYDKIHVEHSVGGVDKIKRIECLINGKVFQTWRDASWLRKVNKGKGIKQKNGVFTLHFDLPYFRQLNDVKSFGIGTADVTNFHIRLVLSADATNPTLKATAQVSQVKPLGLISIIRSFPITKNAGVADIDNIPKGARILAIHLEKDDITHCELKVNQVVYFEASKALNDLQLEQAIPNPREPMDGVFTLDFTTQGTPAGALITSGVRDLRLRPTLGSEGNIEMTIEYWGLLGSA